MIDVILSQTLLNRDVNKIFTERYSEKMRVVVTESLARLLSYAEERGATDVFRRIDYFAYHSAFNRDGYLHMAHNRAYLDERAPVYDNDLLDLHLEIPTSMRLSARLFKKVLRIIAPQLAKIPLADTSTLPLLPDYVEYWFMFWQKVMDNIMKIRTPNIYKQGSWLNFNEWMRRNNKFRKIISETVNNEKCLNPEIFNIENIKYFIKKHMNREEDHEELLLLLLTFGRWHAKYGP